MDFNTSAKSNSNKDVNEISFVGRFLLGKIEAFENKPWELLSCVPKLISELKESLSETNEIQNFQTPDHTASEKLYKLEGDVHFTNPSTVLIGEGTEIEHGALIMGPCIIGKNCQIRKGAYLRGNIIIGDGSLIGNSCELKNALIMDKSQIVHFNYVGDSILGIHAHFAAGAITSNYKLDGSSITTRVPSSDGVIPAKTDLIKFGALVGNNVEIGCNSVLNPGSIIGRNSVIYPLTNWRGYLGPASICKNVQKYEIVERRFD